MTTFRLRIVVLAASLAACGGGGDDAAPKTPTGVGPAVNPYQGYVDSAVTLMQTRAFYRRRVDWTSVRATARSMASTATSTTATYPAIRWALTQLGDHHSFLQPPVQGVRLDPELASAAPVDSLTAMVLSGRYGYLHVPTFSTPGGASDNAVRSAAFADTLQALVRFVDASRPCGWVVDLRRNLGGNMWPMLVGVGPILGQGTVGSFVDPDGNKTAWFYEAGVAGVTQSGQRFVQAQTTRAPVVLSRAEPPVAVLTDSLTASSGEAITVAFRGRANARSFGAATLGVPTANSGFPLADRAFLFLMTAVDADRTGREYDDRIAPDVAVPQLARPLTDDATVQAATAWLATTAACASPSVR